MLETIHETRIGEFSRILRAGAIAASQGRRAILLTVDDSEDPQGFLRAFHRYCRERAGRPVRKVQIKPGSIGGTVRQIARFFDIESALPAPDAKLTDLLGAQKIWFEALRSAVAADLATSSDSSGPGILVIEGDLLSQPDLIAFLDHLTPSDIPWSTLPGKANDNFLVVAAADTSLADSSQILRTARVEKIAVHPLGHEDLRASIDSAEAFLGVALKRDARWEDRTASTQDSNPALNDGDPSTALANGAFKTALELAIANPAGDCWTRARIFAACSRIDSAISALAEGLSAQTIDPARAIEAATFASAVGEPDKALDFLNYSNDTDEPQKDIILSGIALHRGDNDSAIVAAERAIQNAPDQVFLANAHNAAGSAHFRMGLLDSASRHFSLAHSLVNPDGREAAKAKHNLGLVAIRQGQFTDAARHLQSAVLVADGLRDAFGSALTRRNLAITYEYLGKYMPALEFAVQAAQRMSRLDRKADLAASLLTIADLMGTFGEMDRAMTFAKLAVEYGEGNAIVSARAIFKTAEARYLCLGSDNVIDALALAIDKLSSAGLKDMAAFAGLRLAAALLDEGSVDLAEDALARIDSKTPDNEVNGIKLWLSGRVDLARGLPAIATSRFMAAREILTRLCQREPLAMTLYDWSIAAIDLEDHELKDLLLQSAQDIVRDMAESIPSAHRQAFLHRPSIRRMAGLAIESQGHHPELERTVPPTVTAGPLPRLREKVPGIIGTSEGTRKVLATIERVRDVDVSVLLLGESGTGKELFAEAIHRLSHRATGPFVRVNAAAFSEDLLLSELFGHERGAFTGAHARKIGRFEAAHGGTLFLDEIGDISPRLQAALLRVIEGRRFERLGSSETISVDVRLVFATNRNLKQLTQTGHFREDLFHRISGITIPVPPLRERVEDVPDLVSAFVAEMATEQGHEIGIEDGVISLLTGWDWPGNIRQLHNVVRKTVLMHPGPALTVRALLEEHPELKNSKLRSSSGDMDVYDMVFGRGMPMFEARREVEIALVREALSRVGGNIAAAARLLGMKRPRLSQMVKDFGINTEEIRDAKEGT